MKRICANCGHEIEEGIAFCTECGNKAPEEVKNREQNSEPAHASAEIETASVQVKEAHKSESAKAEVQQEVTRKPESSVQTAVVQERAVKVVGTGAFFGLMLLFALPVVGFIACIIMAFAPKNKNIKNFARAILIWILIAVVIAGILALIAFLLSNAISGLIESNIGSEIGSIKDVFGELGSLGQLSELEGMLGQIVTEAGETIPVE